MSPSNFTPISGKNSKKKKSSILKVVSLLTLLVTFIGVGVGYVMVQRGFNFRPKATTISRNLVKYGWNGTCFTNASIFKYGARYQCPGKIELYGNGCQGSVSKRTGHWEYNSVQNPLTTNGQSNVCIVPDGSDGPKDSNGCFTQQLDVDDGSAGSPEGFYSFDSCGSPVPTDPKPPAVTTCTGGLYCDNTPVISPAIGDVVCGLGDANWSGYESRCDENGKWAFLGTRCNRCVVTPTPAVPILTPTPSPYPYTSPTVTPSPTPTVTPTPTPAVCIAPLAPANVHINCPLCSQAAQ